VILGSHRRDWITGLGGDDLICGRRGTDTLDGSHDADRIRGGKGRDYIGGGHGDDTLSGGGWSDSLFPSIGDDRIDGGPGRSDFLSYHGHDKRGVVVNLRKRIATGLGRDVLRSVEGAAAGYGRDRFIGDHKANVFSVESYGRRREMVSGGRGNDGVYVLSGTFHLRIDGGRGRDEVGFISAGAIDLDLAAGTVRFIGYGGPADSEIVAFENAGGSESRDILRGDAGSNRLRGFSGHDRIFGKGGNDRLNGWGFGRPDYGRSDYLNGGSGRDRCRNATKYRSCEIRTGQRR
jgi:Ca2+-binding RTX toxin-like protein